MHEAVLRNFFLGRVPPERLAADVAEALVAEGEQITLHPIVDMDEELLVTSEHLLRVCDAVLAGVLEPDRLPAIGFCLMASDRFFWGTDTPDGEVVAETVHDWSAPEINYPLTIVNVGAFRARLLNLPAQFHHQPADGGTSERRRLPGTPSRL